MRPYHLYGYSRCCISIEPCPHLSLHNVTLPNLLPPSPIATPAASDTMETDLNWMVAFEEELGGRKKNNGSVTWRWFNHL